MANYCFDTCVCDRLLVNTVSMADVPSLDNTLCSSGLSDIITIRNGKFDSKYSYLGKGNIDVPSYIQMYIIEEYNKEKKDFLLKYHEVLNHFMSKSAFKDYLEYEYGESDFKNISIRENVNKEDFILKEISKLIGRIYSSVVLGYRFSKSESCPPNSNYHYSDYFGSEENAYCKSLHHGYLVAESLENSSKYSNTDMFIKGVGHIPKQDFYSKYDYKYLANVVNDALFLGGDIPIASLRLRCDMLPFICNIKTSYVYKDTNGVNIGPHPNIRGYFGIGRCFDSDYGNSAVASDNEYSMLCGMYIDTGDFDKGVELKKLSSYEVDENYLDSQCDLISRYSKLISDRYKSFVDFKYIETLLSLTLDYYGIPEYKKYVADSNLADVFMNICLEVSCAIFEI